MRVIAGSLIVTILGGILVFHYTDIIRYRSAKLVYSNETVSISGEKVAVTVATIRIENVGSESAESVEITVYHKEGSGVAEYDFNLQSGPVIPKLISINPEISQILIDELRPSDIFSAKLIFDGLADENIDVKVRAKSITGVVRDEYDRTRKFIDKSWIVIFASLFWLALSIFILIRMRKKIRKANLSVGYSPNLNNTAFMLLHAGFNEMAEKMLEDKIYLDGGSVHEVSNYAVCKALSGNPEKAIKINAAAKQMIKTDHDEAVVLMNESVIMMKINDEVSAKQALSKAYEKSGRVAYWVEYSEIIDKELVQAIKPTAPAPPPP